jgi:hypothetical protein
VNITMRRGDFHCLGQPGHAARARYSATPKVGSGSLASGCSHLEALARSTGL